MEKWKNGRRDEAEMEEASRRREDVMRIKREGATCRGTLYFVPRVYARHFVVNTDTL